MPSGGGPAARSRSCSAAPPTSDARPTSSTRYVAWRGPRAATRCARSRASVWSCCWAADGDLRAAAQDLVDVFGAGPVVVGPLSDSLGHAHASARAALSAYRAASGWPGAPRPVGSDELLPERVLAGDGHARRYLVDEVYLPLLTARGALLETVAAYLESGGSIEATARTLFVHPNTVRYRLRQTAELTGFGPTQPRDALALQLAIVLGRQSGREA